MGRLWKFEDILTQVDARQVLKKRGSQQDEKFTPP